MERYDIRQGEWMAEKAEAGDFVLYADAQATVEALQAQVKQLEHGLTTQADAADMWYDEFLRIRALNASPEINGICDRALDGIPRTVPVVQENHQLRQQVEALQAQLPAEMQGCTILFKECEKGHGRLVATNWRDHGCQTCEVDALQRERDALKLVNETHMKTVMKLSHIVEQSGAALDAEREKLVAVAKERDVQCTLKQNCISMLEQEREKVKGLEAQLEQVQEERSKYIHAVGLATTCAADMQIDTSHPIEMMQEVCKRFTRRTAELEALQRENECKDTLIETLQAQLAQRGKDGENE